MPEIVQLKDILAIIYILDRNHRLPAWFDSLLQY